MKNPSFDTFETLTPLLFIILKFFADVKKGPEEKHRGEETVYLRTGQRKVLIGMAMQERTKIYGYYLLFIPPKLLFV